MLLLLLFVFLSVATSTEGGDGDGHTAFVTPVADRGDARPDSPGAARPVGVSAPGDTGTVPTPGAANTGAAHPGGPGPGAGATGPDLRLPPLELFSEYERSYTTVTPFGADSCFYVEEVRRGNTLDLEYLVLDTDPNSGRRMTVSVTLRDPRRAVVWSDRGKESGRAGGAVAEMDGDYEICFHNRKGSGGGGGGGGGDKTVSWEISVEGKVDRVVLEEAMSGMIARDVEHNSGKILEALDRVRMYMAKSMRLQWMSKFAHNKDGRYMTALSSE